MKNRNGYLIIEVLIALLVFSLGIMGALKMQANSVSNAISYSHRFTAIELVNSLAAKINLDFINVDQYVSGTSPSYKEWLDELDSSLPNALDKPPEIILENINGNSVLSITIYWKEPSENEFSKYTIKMGVV